MIWKVVAQTCGLACALAGPDAQRRPIAGETVIWEGEAWDNGEAFRKAYKANPCFDIVNHRVDQSQLKKTRE